MRLLSNKIFTPSSWSLKTQLGLCLLIFLLGLTQIATVLVYRTESKSELADLEARSHHTVLLTSAMLSMAIKDNDIDGLEEFVTQTFLHDPNVTFVSIFGIDGENLLELGDPTTPGREGFVTYSDPIAYSILNLGTVHVTWDTSFIDAVIKAQVRQTRIILNSFLVALGLLLFMGGQFLIFRPLSILDKRIQDLRGGGENISSLPALNENKTREWAQLSHSTNLLQTAILEKEDRENELMLARDLALQTSKIKSDLLTNISHEFRTPLNGIIGLSELLLTTEVDEEQQDYAEGILESGNNLLEVVTGLLDLSTIEADGLEFDIQDIDLAAVVEDVVGQHKPLAAEKRLPLSFQPACNLQGKIQSDPHMIAKIITNLLDNAIRFTENGAVAVTLDSKLLIGNTYQFAINIIDTGIGIPREEQAKIFESFYQADGSLTRAHEGNGLGLAISKGLAQKLSGEIRVQSEEGVGSTFTLLFTAALAETFVSPQAALSQVEI